MPEVLVRFKRFDDYRNAVFTTSNQKENERKDVSKIKKWYEKLKKLDYETFLPVYHSDEYDGYATIRFSKSNVFRNLNENHKYKIKFDFKTMTRKKDGVEKKYINCVCKAIKFVSKPKEIPSEILDLSSVAINSDEE